MTAAAASRVVAEVAQMDKSGDHLELAEALPAIVRMPHSRRLAMVALDLI